MLEGAEVRLAVDIGGTFTDIVLDRGRSAHDPQGADDAAAARGGACWTGMRLVLADAQCCISPTSTCSFTARRSRPTPSSSGAARRTALIATDGFRDMLDIATESRYDQYDLSIEKPKPLVPRALRFTVPERVDVHGAVRLAARRSGGAALAPSCAAEATASRASRSAFMHSYANPDARAAHGRDPERGDARHLSITLSSAVCPEIREYERTSTAVANAYVQPLMDGYLARMDEALAGRAVPRRDLSGDLGRRRSPRSRRRAVSGAPGRIRPRRRRDLRGADRGALGESKVLSFDMGGTTAKICLIEKYRAETSRVFEVDRAARFLKGSGLPVRIPVIEMVEIGAGGGSIAHVDALKRVTVGPESAGSEPGPACYGRGGHAPDRDRCGRGARHDRSRRASPAARSRSIRSCRRRRCCDDVGEPLGLSPKPRPTRCTKWSARTWRARRACTRSSAARSSASTR